MAGSGIGIQRGYATHRNRNNAHGDEFVCTALQQCLFSSSAHAAGGMLRAIDPA
jgi:hypothetical protein